jgi:serine protease Do
MGIVSALQRANFGEVEYENFIQTDAAINPGNSGGALVNMRGELIGINAAILSQTGGNVGIAFAIPSNMVLQVVNAIMKNGKIVHGTLGVAIQKVDQDVIDAFNLSSDKGVIITDVASGSPAEQAGLKREDVVLKMNDEEIIRRNQFRNKIAFTSPGEKVRLTVLRQGKTVTLDATVGERPQPQIASAGTLHPKPGGLAVADLSTDLRKQIGVPDEIPGKVIVMQVEPGSVADISGFNPGDIILEVNHQGVSSLSQYKDLYQAAKGNVIFLVRRPDGFFFKLMRNNP